MSVNPGDWILPGKNLDRALDGIATPGNHSKAHHKEFGVRQNEFRDLAAHSIANSHIGGRVTDPAGNQRFVLGHNQSGAVSWVVPHKPEQSTTFRVKDPGKYVTRQVLASNKGSALIDPPAIRAKSKELVSPTRAKRTRPSIGPASPKAPTPAPTGKAAPARASSTKSGPKPPTPAKAPGKSGASVSAPKAPAPAVKGPTHGKSGPSRSTGKLK